MKNLISICLSCVFWLGAISCPQAIAADLSPLPSWREGAIKTTIVDFVADVTNPNSVNFVKADDRIAVFDHDGTLWSEQPCLFQQSFILYQQGSSAQCLPEELDPGTTPLTLEEVFWADAWLNAGMTIDRYKQEVKQFLATVHHPDFDRPYEQLIFKPMVELIDYLKNYDFQVYICSGGGIDFIRSFAEEAYGIPPANVIGSTIQYKFEFKEGKSVLVRVPIPVLPLNLYAEKPVEIERHIGKRPIMTVGNSTGDLQLLQYTDEGQGYNLMMLVHHDDPDREYQYDDGAEEVLAEAKVRGWNIISMKNDFIKVFPWE